MIAISHMETLTLVSIKCHRSNLSYIFIPQQNFIRRRPLPQDLSQYYQITNKIATKL